MDTRKFSRGGLIVALISLFISVSVYEGRGPTLTFVSLIGAGFALLIRSFRPPLSYGRGLATCRRNHSSYNR